MEKIDIHCHILPGIDDGAETMEETLKMLKMAAEDGIRQMIATPHFHYRRGHASPEQIRMLAARVQKQAEKENIPVKIYSGNELYYTQELLEIVKAGEALTLADSDYVLLEFSMETEGRRIQNAVYEFLAEGYHPVIAHMERYEVFRKDADFTEMLFRMGAYFQLNAGSVAGNAGWKVKRYSKKVLNAGMIHFIATDAHDLKKRIPAFGKTMVQLEKAYGIAAMSEWMHENPMKILKNIE